MPKVNYKCPGCGNKAQLPVMDKSIKCKNCGKDMPCTSVKKGK
jgi:DNA-directed RNA polymerase subunit RPC12/RpoP